MGADLRSADLRQADLRGACLVGAYVPLCPRGLPVLLNGADLREARFSEAQGSSSQDFLDLTTCQGLDSAVFSPGFLESYLVDALTYAYRELQDKNAMWPGGFLEDVLERVPCLQRLCDYDVPSDAVVSAIDTVNQELIRYLAQHPKALYEITPRAFEVLIAEVLAALGWHVELTQYTKDGGYDILGISKDVKAGVKTSWLIECKRYAPHRKVGVGIVRVLYGAKLQLNVANMMLATTSHFTRGAWRFQASRYDLELKDYEGVLEWINEYHPHPNGKLYIKDNQVVVP